MFGKPRRLGKAIYTGSKRGPFVFGVRRGKVRYAAVSERVLTAARGRGSLGRSLRDAGFR